MELNNTILSICVPTIGRKKELIELLNRCLMCTRKDFDICITGSCSKEEREYIEKEISDDRVKNYELDTELDPHLKMVKSIYNADGLFAMYCNDRDLISSEALETIIDFLDNNRELGFVYSAATDVQYSPPKFFKKGFDSIISQDWVHHPTGMIFNTNVLKRIPFEKIQSYYAKDLLYYHDYLMRETFMYAGSAIYNCALWENRGMQYLGKSRSTSSLNPKATYFLPSNIMWRAKRTFVHVFENCDFDFSPTEMLEVVKSIVVEYYPCGEIYKIDITDENLASRYGLKRKWISGREVMAYDEQFTKEFIDFIKESSRGDDSWLEWITGYHKKMKKTGMRRNIMNNLRIVKRELMYWIVKERR